MRYLVFDTETTGIGPDKQAVEVAMVELDPDTLEIIGDEQALLRPTVPISPEAQAVHGITAEMLADKPTIHEWVASHLQGGLDGDIVLIGHKVAFDKPLFEPIGRCTHTIDTIILAQLHVVGAPNRKLETLCEYLDLPRPGDAHRAMADVLRCYHLLKHLLPITGRTLHDIATTPHFMLHHMPWGKHEGELLINVPIRYRQWLLGLPDLDIHLRRSLELLAPVDPPLQVRPQGSSRRRIFIPKRS